MADLKDYIRVYDGALSEQQCQRYLNILNAPDVSTTRNGKDVYAHLQDSSWDELNLNNFIDNEEFKQLVQVLHHYKSKYEQECNISTPLPMPDGLGPLTIKKYLREHSDGFEPHYDSAGSKCTRYLVFLFYLNDVEQGGETRFNDLGVDIAPKQGRLLIFPPYWMYRHQGMPPLSGDKAILSTYYLWWK